MSNREITLGWLTALVILGGLTFWGAQSKLEEWRSTYKDRDALARRVRTAQRMLNKQEEWQTQFQSLMGELPSHPMGKDVTADLLKTLERTSQDHGLTLLRREPKDEKNLGNLYQVSIICTWEGDLKALVQFLYAVHTKGAILDIRQLTVTPIQGKADRLKGGFTVDCAYTRTEQSAQSDKIQVDPVL